MGSVFDMLDRAVVTDDRVDGLAGPVMSGKLFLSYRHVSNVGRRAVTVATVLDNGMVTGGIRRTGYSAGWTPAGKPGTGSVVVAVPRDTVALPYYFYKWV